ncbi:hypothetical protein BASA81_007106 [Batrachochytrium salamandrivorans]|nr:hypothetical protein BASA81_007106 [Batrachochytrium salamandrivorans]
MDSTEKAVPGAVCRSDMHCPGNEICVSNATWFDPSLYSPCMCSPYFGTTNSSPNCGGVLETSASWFWVITSALLLVLGGGLILYSTWEIARLARHRMLAVDPQTIGSLQIVLGSMSGVAAVAGNLSAALLPKKWSYTSTPPIEKQSELHVVWIVLLCVTSTSVVSGANTIALMWLDVAHKCERMQLATASRSHGRQLAKAVFVIEALVLVSVLVPVLLGYKSVTIFQGRDSDEYAQVLRSMQKSTVVICVCFVGSVLFSSLMMAPMVLGWKNYVKPGTVSMQAWALQILYLTAFVVGFEIIRFLGKSTTNKLEGRGVSTRREELPSPPPPPPPPPPPLLPQALAKI